MQTVLFVGNKNYSSWSLRPWLALTWAGVDFETRVIPLGGEGYGQARIPAVVAVSPSGRVPALQVGEATIWDSLAISEYAAELDPTLWPADPLVRGVARAATAEMHSSFTAVRRDLSMNLRRRVAARTWPADTAADIARITTSWADLRARYGSDGPWLFGRRSVADAFYAPVATRFRTYSVAVPAVCSAYMETLFADPAFKSWEADAIAEPLVIEQTEALYR